MTWVKPKPRRVSPSPRSDVIGPVDVYYCDASKSIYVRWTKDGPACLLTTLRPETCYGSLRTKLRDLRMILSRSSLRTSRARAEAHILEFLDQATGDQAHRQMMLFPTSELQELSIPPKLRK